MNKKWAFCPTGNFANYRNSPPISWSAKVKSISNCSFSRLTKPFYRLISLNLINKSDTEKELPWILDTVGNDLRKTFCSLKFSKKKTQKITFENHLFFFAECISNPSSLLLSSRFTRKFVSMWFFLKSRKLASTLRFACLGNFLLNNSLEESGSFQ